MSPGRPHGDMCLCEKCIRTLAEEAVVDHSHLTKKVSPGRAEYHLTPQGSPNHTSSARPAILTRRG